MYFGRDFFVNTLTHRSVSLVLSSLSFVILSEICTWERARRFLVCAKARSILRCESVRKKIAIKKNMYRNVDERASGIRGIGNRCDKGIEFDDSDGEDREFDMRSTVGEEESGGMDRI